MSGTLKFDIVALRDDVQADVEWIDKGFGSTTEWQEQAHSKRQSGRNLAGKRANNFRRARSSASLDEVSELQASRTTSASFRSQRPRSTRSLEDPGSTGGSSSSGTWRQRFRESRHPSTRSFEGVASEIQKVPFAEDTPCSAPLHSLPEERLTDAETCDAGSTGAVSLGSTLAEEPVPLESMRIVERCCKRCQGRYTGFGDVCSICRKFGPRPSIQHCTKCSQFFTGFRGTCQDCASCQPPSA